MVVVVVVVVVGGWVGDHEDKITQHSHHLRVRDGSLVLGKLICWWDCEGKKEINN